MVMLKIETRSVCNKSKKFTAKLGLGLNFAGNVDFWACNEDFNKKSERKNVAFVVFL